MKYYHKCITGHGTELWAYTHTWFGAAMAAFGAQGATFVKTDKDKTKVEYTGGWVYRQTLRERADQTVEEMYEQVIGAAVPVIAVEVEGYALDATGNMIHESDLDPETHLEQTYAKVRYGVYLVFGGAGRDGVADFVDREDAEHARDELITYFGIDAPAPPEEET